MERVAAHGWYVLGEEVEAFESEFAGFCGTHHCVGVGSGLDALHLALRACDVGPGDEVVIPSHTAFPTAAAVTSVGATPTFVDVDEESFCIDPSQVAGAITRRTKAIVPVHLYGRCADMDPLLEVGERHGVAVI
jgi:dTDP-4-amino-4,6-dideoxygalactose transaminase